MLIRYVRMTFQADKLTEFEEIFTSSKYKIRAMQDCCHLELMRDINQPNIYITHSQWESETDLNNYRNSELFKTTWAKIKVLFAEKPLAFSVESLTVA
jgi:quinol monooxygenase YgiN